MQGQGRRVCRGHPGRSPAGDPGRRPVPPVEEPVRGGGEDRGRAPPLPAAAAAAAQAGPPSLSPPPVPVPAAEPAAPPGRTRRLAERTRARYAEVQECLARGLSRAAVSRELNLDIQTVRRFANASCAEELLGKAEHRSTKLDPFIDLVNQRWNEGVTNAEAITAELRTLGFKGDAQTVRRYLRPFRLPGTSRSHPDPHRRKPAPAAPAVPKPRTISKALLTHPDRLSEDDALIVKNATAGCAHLERLQQHVRSFAKIMARRRGQELPAWLEAVETDDLPELRSLAAGMRRDLAAVINGLTLEHSSGAVEGNVTRVKRLKRDGYGRANFDLLRAPDTRRRLSRRHVIIARAELRDRPHPRHPAHFCQRVHLPARVGNGAGHGLGLLMLAGLGQRRGHRRQRLRPLGQVGDGAGHGLGLRCHRGGLLVLAGLGQRPGHYGRFRIFRLVSRYRCAQLP